MCVRIVEDGWTVELLYCRQAEEKQKRKQR